jgi:hypothetical protein
MTAILTRLAKEPVLVRSALAGLISIAALAGITVPDGLLDKAVDAIGIAASVLLVLSARNKVTPV